jgi:ATP-dependent DNA helicase RecQ
MRGEREIALFALPQVQRAARRGAPLAVLAAESGQPAPDERLFEHLRALRRKLAAERGVPPYLIFGDRTLAGLAALQPRSEAELLTVKGIGEKKAQDLGPAILAAIREHKATADPGGSEETRLQDRQPRGPVGIG